MDEAYLRELIEEATVDCYDEYEQFWGFWTALEDELHFPFSATVLGDRVQVVGLNGDRSDERRGVMVNVEKGGKRYAFPLSELDVSELADKNAAWVAAYALWSSV